jgi:hypothetical protein
MWDKMARVIDSSESLRKKLNRAFYDKVNARINKNKNRALAEFKKLTYDFLVNSPTYESLVSGDLAFHFGFRKGEEESRLQPILNTFINSVGYEFKPYSEYGGGFEFFAIDNGYEDVLSLSVAKIQGGSKNGVTEYPLPWLNWLLLQGDRIIVPDHKIKIGAINSSRSGKAIMVEGGSWAVPTLYAGTKDDNWVTKIGTDTNGAIGSYQKRMQHILERML